MLYFYTTYILLSRNILLYIQAKPGRGDEEKKRSGMECDYCIAASSH